MPPRAFWMSMGLTMRPGVRGAAEPMHGYRRAVDAGTIVGVLADPVRLRGVDAGTMVGLLADPVRLRVVSALALGAGTIEEVAQASGLSLKEVALAARRLSRAGLVHRDGHDLALHTERFGEAARAAAASAPAVEPLSVDPAEDAVLRSFLRAG